MKTVAIIAALAAALCAAAWAAELAVDARGAESLPAVTINASGFEVVDGKPVAWWARRARSNGRTARAEAHGIRHLRRVLRRRLAPLENRYEHAAKIFAVAYGVSADTLIRKGRCESVGWTKFHNRSGASGPWQFLPSTWRSTPFAGFSPYDPEAAAAGAAWMHAHGRGGEWVCR